MSKDDDSILSEARARFKEAMEADDENRREALDDLKFAWNYNDYQWPTEAKRLRKNRPCLTENRLPQFIRQIVNAQRANRPSISVVPANSQAGPAVAKVIEGMIRHVEQWSKADLAYDNAFEAAVTSSVGYFRIATEYADDETFDQDVCIKPIDNAFSVYDDPRYQLPDGSDRRYCFVTEMVRRDEFKAEYGFEATTIDEIGSGDDWQHWFEEDNVRVAEYWRVRKVRKEIEAPGPDGQTRKRDVEQRIVEQFLMTGDRIIKKSDWLGTLIPIIPVFGETKNIEGKKLRKSLIRDAKAAQQINNYFLSAEIEATALQPKAPYIGPVGAFETDKHKWDNAHIENYPYLEYDAIDGQPPPQRQPPPQFPAALRESRMGAIEGMKAQMGLYDASLGARSNETSGVAIDERQQQGDTATYHFIDNMMRAIRYAGSVIIDLLPKVYDAPRVARIIQPDGQADMVAINQIFIDPTTYQPAQINLAAGKYDVVVKSGPSFLTQRQETAKAISELVRAFPPLMQQAGDLLIKNMDFPDADKIAERLAPQGGLPPQVQQQIQGLQQQLGQAQQALAMGKQAYDQLQQKANKLELDGMRKDVEKVALQAQIRDKQGSIAADVHDTNEETRRFVLDKIVELIGLQQKQAQPVIDEATQMQPGVTHLVS